MSTFLLWTVQKSPRARARAREEFCIVHDRKAAMLAGKLKCSFSGDRWGFQVNMGPLRTRLLPQRTTRRRARALYCPQ